MCLYVRFGLLRCEFYIKKIIQSKKQSYRWLSDRRQQIVKHRTVIFFLGTTVTIFL